MASGWKNGSLRDTRKLSLYMYQKPKTAKRLFFDVIPRNVDDYQQFLDGFSRQDAAATAKSGLAYSCRPAAEGRHAGHVPAVADAGVVVENAENAGNMWGFIGRYRPGVTPQTHPKLDALVGYAINYYRDVRGAEEKFP